MPESNAVAAKPASQANGPESTRGGMYYTPRVDICESDEELTLTCDLPGVRPEDIDLRFASDELILCGKVKPRQTDVQFVMNEYGVGDYHRSFSIHEEIDAAKIAAEYTHGVLTVHLPKKEAVRPRRIVIKGE